MVKREYVFDEVEQEAMKKFNITLNDYRNRRRAGWNRECAIFLDKHQDPKELASIIKTKDLRTIFKSGTTVETVRLKVYLGWRYEDAILAHKRDRRIPRYPAEKRRIIL